MELIDCLPYIKMRLPTDFELQPLPHAVLTADTECDPDIFDRSIADDDQQRFSQFNCVFEYYPHSFDKFRDFKHRHVYSRNQVVNNDIIITHNRDGLLNDIAIRYVYGHHFTTVKPNYDELRPFLGVGSIWTS
jgi:hypothetical protein